MEPLEGTLAYLRTLGDAGVDTAWAYSQTVAAGWDSNLVEHGAPHCPVTAAVVTLTATTVAELASQKLCACVETPGELDCWVDHALEIVRFERIARQSATHLAHRHAHELVERLDEMEADGTDAQLRAHGSRVLAQLVDQTDQRVCSADGRLDRDRSRHHAAVIAPGLPGGPAFLTEQATRQLWARWRDQTLHRQRDNRVLLDELLDELHDTGDGQRHTDAGALAVATVPLRELDLTDDATAGDVADAAALHVTRRSVDTLTAHWDSTYRQRTVQQRLVVVVARYWSEAPDQIAELVGGWPHRAVGDNSDALVAVVDHSVAEVLGEHYGHHAGRGVCNTLIEAAPAGYTLERATRDVATCAQLLAADGLPEDRVWETVWLLEQRPLATAAAAGRAGTGTERP